MLMSIPDDVYEYMDMRGEKPVIIETAPVSVKEKAKDLYAQAIAHEVDHLNGEVFVDKMVPGTLEYITPEDNK